MNSQLRDALSKVVEVGPRRRMDRPPMPEDNCLIVNAIAANGPAAMGGLRAGDLICTVQAGSRWANLTEDGLDILKDSNTRARVECYSPTDKEVWKVTLSAGIPLGIDASTTVGHLLKASRGVREEKDFWMPGQLSSCLSNANEVLRLLDAGEWSTVLNVTSIFTGIRADAVYRRSDHSVAKAKASMGSRVNKDGFNSPMLLLQGAALLELGRAHGSTLLEWFEEFYKESHTMDWHDLCDYYLLFATLSFGITVRVDQRLLLSPEEPTYANQVSHLLEGYLRKKRKMSSRRLARLEQAIKNRAANFPQVDPLKPRRVPIPPLAQLSPHDGVLKPRSYLRTVFPDFDLRSMDSYGDVGVLDPDGRQTLQSTLSRIASLRCASVENAPDIISARARGEFALKMPTVPMEVIVYMGSHRTNGPYHSWLRKLLAMGRVLGPAKLLSGITVLTTWERSQQSAEGRRFAEAWSKAERKLRAEGHLPLRVLHLDKQSKKRFDDSFNLQGLKISVAPTVGMLQANGICHWLKEQFVDNEQGGIGSEDLHEDSDHIWNFIAAQSVSPRPSEPQLVHGLNKVVREFFNFLCQAALSKEDLSQLTQLERMWQNTTRALGAPVHAHQMADQRLVLTVVNQASSSSQAGPSVPLEPAAMSVRELRTELSKRGVRHEHCLEKGELVALFSSEVLAAEGAPASAQQPQQTVSRELILTIGDLPVCALNSGNMPVSLWLLQALKVKQGSKQQAMTDQVRSPFFSQPQARTRTHPFPTPTFQVFSKMLEDKTNLAVQQRGLHPLDAAEEIVNQFAGVLSHGVFKQAQEAIAAVKVQQEALQQAQLAADFNAAVAALIRAMSASELETRGGAAAMHAALERALAEVKRCRVDECSPGVIYATELLSRGPGTFHPAHN